MEQNIPYRSFCWCLGTTSFRTRNFNKTIEEQLVLLQEFWEQVAPSGQRWDGNNGLQAKYYDHMKQRGFVEGEAPNKPKDAREKTSGLVDLGLINAGRRLTPAGQALLTFCQQGSFSDGNFFQIPADSYLYLKQLLKTSCPMEGGAVRPFLVLLYLLAQLEKLTIDEFKYLLPLCTSWENTNQVLKGIRKLREGRTTVEEIILNRLMKQENYQRALELLLKSPVDQDLLCQVGLNRKSRQYDKTYFPLYCSLRSAFLLRDFRALSQVFQNTKNIKVGGLWRAYLFDTVSQVAISKRPEEHLKQTLFDGVSTEQEFKIAFFKVMHLLKAKATLSDYFDLNRRYIKTADVVLFEDGEVKLDLLPQYFFAPVMELLYEQAYQETDLLTQDCALWQIHPALAKREPAVLKALGQLLHREITDINQAREVLETRRYARLAKLMEKKFTRQQLVELLELFEQRRDEKIRERVTDNADIPTIFEYVLGIIWYRISDCQGRILDYMKLSLDGDLLPKTHAVGGEADILYEYSKTQDYPAHTLLLEATLAEKTNQRRMEMEPVSRHLGRHLLQTGNQDSYCLFATTDLDINVISDFRSRKYTPFYDPKDYSRSVQGMKIIPLQAKELKTILLKGKTYKELYPLFQQAYESSLPPDQWYSVCLRDAL